MKNKFYGLMVILLAFFTTNVNGQCDYTLEMNDSFGDGWDGASLEVIVDGVSAGVFTITGAQGAQNIETITVSDGVSIELNYTAGSFENEHSYILFDSNGFPVFSDGPFPAGGTVFIGTTDCTVINTCQWTIDLVDSFGDGWDGAFLTVTVDPDGSSVGPISFDFTIAGGSGATFNPNIIDGEDLEISYTSGSFENEHLYTITDNLGVEVFADGPNPATGVILTQADGCTDPPQCMITSLTVDNVSDCGVPFGNQYEATIILEYADEPGAGTLDVSLNGNTTSFGITGSPQTVVLQGISGGGSVDIDAAFSDIPACMTSTIAAFNAPGLCCGNSFTDSGGNADSYSNGENNVVTLMCPDLGTFQVAAFNLFEVEDGSASGCWDDLQVWEDVDGDMVVSAGDTQFGAGSVNPGIVDNVTGGFCGNNVGDMPDYGKGPGVFVANGTNNCLIFVFNSDGSVSQDGWNATSACVENNCPTVSIADPCDCNDDHNPIVNGIDDDSGTFGETIEINTANPGDTWTVTAVTGLAGVNVGDMFTDGGAGDTDGAVDGVITIVSSHQDGVGYTFEASDGIFTVDIANTCFYPVPFIDVSTTTFCTNAPIIPLGFGEANGAAGTGVFTLNGQIVTEVDPSTLAAGTYNLVLTFDAGTAASFDQTDPGCLQDVVETITIQQAPSSMACNDNVQVSLDENCSTTIRPDMILEGADGCELSYSVDLKSATGASLGDMVDVSNIGSTYVVMVTEITTGNSCWGSITVEDKLDPVLDCPAPTALPCGSDITPIGIANNAPVFLPANVAGTVSIPFNVGQSTIITDLDVLFNLQGGTPPGNVWNNGSITVEVTSPAGTTILLWQLLQGCTPDALNMVFDDEGDPNAFCTNFTTGVNVSVGDAVAAIGAPGLVDFLNIVDGEDAQGDWTLTITDTDAGTLNNLVDAQLIINGNAVSPGIALPAFPNGLTINDVVVIDANTFIAPAGSIDACTDVVLSYVDDVSDEGCASGNTQVITRTWTAQDESGNSDVCLQVITLTRPTINDIQFPVDRDGVDAPGFACDNVPAWDTNGNDYPDATEAEGGVPTAFGIAIDGSCDITCESTDQVLEVCPGTTKILRTWTCIDWCLGQDIEQNQILKIIDEDGPDVSSATELTIDVYDASAPASSQHDVCAGHVVIPPAATTGDNCSGVAGWITQLWSVDANCDPVELLQVIESNGGIFWDVALLENGQPARYQVVYIATDGCDNQSESATCITVVDKVPPVAICDEITEITVTNNGATGEGCSTLYAENLDDGSYDNCKPVWFLMAKMSEAPFSQDLLTRCFYPSRDFCCDEVGTTQQVILLVLDADPSALFFNLNQPFIGCDGTPGLVGTALQGSNINYNTCMVEVIVDDKLPPINTFCPGPQTITCDQYWDDYEAELLLCEQGNDEEACQDNFLATDFGTATFYDNCAVNVTPNVTINLDQCGEGTIVRSWSAVDDNENGPATCTQTIFVNHVSDWAVMFPDDKFVDCGVEVPDFGEPVLYHETCELLAVSFKDELFTTVPDACYKLVREWTVINWCTVGNDIDQEIVEPSECDSGMDYNGNGINCALNAPIGNNGTIIGHGHRTFREDANTPDGYITYQQVIKVNDTVDPVFNDCSIEDMCIFDGCTMTVTLPQPDVSDCSDEVTITVESTTLPGGANGFGPYINVGPGTYTVVYKATDNCGNWSVCETEFSVEDCKKPTPYCVDGLNIEIMNTTPPMVDIWASDFDAGSFDNCQVVCIAFEPTCPTPNNPTDQLVFTCDQVGEQLIQLWVYDGVNWDFCETFVNIQDNMVQCGGDDPQVQGNIATETNDNVAEVDVQINSSSWNSMYTTDATGMFDVSDVPANGDYTITPVKDINPLNGVTTFDLVQISKHILNIDMLDTPYQMIAADANKSGGITTFDMVQVRKLILYIDSEFANNTSWRFVPKSYNFTDASNPFADNFPEVINLNNITVDQLAQDFVAIKIGDVNGSANTNNLLGADDRNFNGALTLSAEDIRVEAGKTYNVEFTANNFNHFGYQFTLNYNGLEFVEVGAGLATAENFGTALVSENAITASWNKADAVNLSSDEAVFTLAFTANTTAQLSDLLSIDSRYTAAESYASNGDIQDVNLEFNGTVVANGFELFQNTPNPFSDATVIGFSLPTATTATITISDISGRILKTIEGDFAKGYNQVDVTRDGIPASGVLYYQLDTDTDSATKKMILID